MLKKALPLCLCAAVLALPACSSQGSDDNAAGTAQTPEASKAAGGQTIAAGLDQNSKFFQAAKAVGLDATLAGPGPYTVFVPTDEAFAKLPADATADLAKPENKAQMTRILTNHILAGTMLAEDIGKAIDKNDGKVTLATMAGGTITATKDGGNIVLTDSGGDKATVTKADQKRSNGVVHQIDAVLMPQQPDTDSDTGE